MCAPSGWVSVVAHARATKVSMSAGVAGMGSAGPYLRGLGNGESGGGAAEMSVVADAVVGWVFVVAHTFATKVSVIAGVAGMGSPGP